MQGNWKKARNHYFAMTALAMVLGGLAALFDPALGSAVAVPLAFLAAQTAGAKFGELAGRAMSWDEAWRLSAIAAAVQVGVFLGGLGLVMATDPQPITNVRYDRIAGIVVVTGGITFLLTLGGLRFGVFLALRRAKRRGGQD